MSYSNKIAFPSKDGNQFGIKKDVRYLGMRRIPAFAGKILIRRTI